MILSAVSGSSSSSSSSSNNNNRQQVEQEDFRGISAQAAPAGPLQLGATRASSSGSIRSGSSSSSSSSTGSNSCGAASGLEEMLNDLIKSAGGGVSEEANCCAGCREPIRDKFIFSVLNLHWHQDCVQCCDCLVKLSERCYALDGKLYCKLDYWRHFGPKCFACSGSIGLSEFVQKLTGDRVYHLTCFTCTQCRKELKTGEQLYLIDNGKRLLCGPDYHQFHFSQQHQHQHQHQHPFKGGAQQKQPPHQQQQHMKLHHQIHAQTHLAATGRLNPPPVAPPTRQQRPEKLSLVELVGTAHDPYEGGAVPALATPSHLRATSSGQQPLQLAQVAPRAANQQRAQILDVARAGTTSSSSRRQTNRSSHHHPQQQHQHQQHSNQQQSADAIASIGNVSAAQQSAFSGSSPAQNTPSTTSTGRVDGRRGPKRPRTILTTSQRRAFKNSFDLSQKPCRKVREALAKETGLSVRIVQVWFQNQRAKLKKIQRKQTPQQHQQQVVPAPPGSAAPATGNHHHSASAHLLQSNNLHQYVTNHVLSGQNSSSSSSSSSAASASSSSNPSGQQQLLSGSQHAPMTPLEGGGPRGLAGTSKCQVHSSSSSRSQRLATTAATRASHNNLGQVSCGTRHPQQQSLTDSGQLAHLNPNSGGQPSAGLAFDPGRGVVGGTQKRRTGEHALLEELEQQLDEVDEDDDDDDEIEEDEDEIEDDDDDDDDVDDEDVDDNDDDDDDDDDADDDGVDEDEDEEPEEEDEDENEDLGKRAFQKQLQREGEALEQLEMELDKSEVDISLTGKTNEEGKDQTSLMNSQMSSSNNNFHQQHLRHHYRAPA